MTHPGGCPTKYKAEYCEQVEKLCAEGFSDRKVADFFNTSYQTIYNWQAEHPEFLEHMRRGKDSHDVDIAEGRLKKRVKGYRYTEVTKEPDKHGNMVVVKKVTKTIMPDLGAIKFHLTNRQPRRWKNLQNSQVSGPDGGPVEVKEIPVRFLEPGEKPPEDDE